MSTFQHFLNTQFRRYLFTASYYFRPTSTNVCRDCPTPTHYSCIEQEFICFCINFPLSQHPTRSKPRPWYIFCTAAQQHILYALDIESGWSSQFVLCKLIIYINERKSRVEAKDGCMVNHKIERWKKPPSAQREKFRKKK